MRPIKISVMPDTALFLITIAEEQIKSELARANSYKGHMKWNKVEIALERREHWKRLRDAFETQTASHQAEVHANGHQ
ncbi:MAG: hypothetical protein AAFS11_02115 [Planctomycetota bacterium]